MTDATGGLWRKLEQGRLEAQTRTVTDTAGSPKGRPGLLGEEPPAPVPIALAAGGQRLISETLLNGTVVVTNVTPPPSRSRDHEYSPPPKRFRRANPADYQRVGRSLL
jgi:hypothetical protein